MVTFLNHDYGFMVDPGVASAVHLLLIFTFKFKRSTFGGCVTLLLCDTVCESWLGHGS